MKYDLPDRSNKMLRIGIAIRKMSIKLLILFLTSFWEYALFCTYLKTVTLTQECIMNKMEAGEK